MSFQEKTMWLVYNFVNVSGIKTSDLENHCSKWVWLKLSECFMIKDL